MENRYNFSTILKVEPKSNKNQNEKQKQNFLNLITPNKGWLSFKGRCRFGIEQKLFRKLSRFLFITNKNKIMGERLLRPLQAMAQVFESTETQLKFYAVNMPNFFSSCPSPFSS